MPKEPLAIHLAMESVTIIIMYLETESVSITSIIYLALFILFSIFKGSQSPSYWHVCHLIPGCHHCMSLTPACGNADR